MLYTNKNYKVELAEGATEYTVTNVETGVVEFTNPSLPRCIIVAQESEAALDRYLPKEVNQDASNVISLR